MENNYKEVGFTPDDNNNTRLPGTVVPEPQRGDSAYGQGKWRTGKATPLDTKDTAGVVGKPTLEIDGCGLEGSLTINTNSNVDMKNSDTTLMAPVGDSGTNLSAKYKYPNVSQSANPLDKNNRTYNDHS